MQHPLCPHREVQKQVLNQLSKEILAGKVNSDAIIGINLDADNQIEFINLDEVSIH